jgi:TonB family protein
MLRKQHLLLYTWFFPFAMALAQAPDSSTDTVTAKSIHQADQMPYFTGCSALPDGSAEKRACSNQTLVTFIAKNLEIPTQNGETGAVYVQFHISEMGKVEDISILRGLSAAHNESALRVVKSLPDWEPAKKDSKPIKVQMTLPIRFVKKDESEFSNGFRLSWGKLNNATTNRETLLKLLTTPITVRDDIGNPLEINELLFERDRNGKFADAVSNGTISSDMQSLVKKLKVGDVFTVTATVQKKGQFYYVEKSFKIED